MLASVLLIIAGVLAYLGTRLHHLLGVERPRRAVSVLIAAMWLFTFLSFGTAIDIYCRALVRQYGNITLPANPISPVTDLSALLVFIAIAYFSRRDGWKVALASALVGTIAAPMIFELPFD